MKALTISMKKRQDWTEIGYMVHMDDWRTYVNCIRIDNAEEQTVQEAVRLLIQNAYETEREIQKGEET